LTQFLDKIVLNQGGSSLSKRKIENKNNKDNEKLNEILKKAKKMLEPAKGSKSEYWFGYCRAIYDLFPELEENKKNKRRIK